MKSTMTSKILARTSGKKFVVPGDFILADVQVLTVADSAAFIKTFDEKGLRLWDPERVLFCFDHFFADWLSVGASKEHPRIRRFAEMQGIPRENIYDVGRNGISHQVPVEKGWVVPGTVCVGLDTQSASMGAVNCFAIPVLSGTASVAITGKLWQVVPECVRLNFHGTVPAGIRGKDIVYRLIKDFGDSVGGRVIEVGGAGVDNLSVDMRMSICNGAVQMGALTIIFPYDLILETYLSGRARSAYEPVSADQGAPYVDVHDYDLGAFSPLISGPHDIDVIRTLDELEGLPIQAGYIGSCSSGRLEDLQIAADVLRGRRVNSSVRLIVTPISTDVMNEAEARGLLAVFRDAGAQVTTPGCGACYVGNASPLKLSSGERCIAASVENLRGRMGAEDAEIYLGNAAVVAASSIAGRITSPAPYLEA
jgi:3-isopropylmalate/(R)-2-methylmalate dehydratase large subunit